MAAKLTRLTHKIAIHLYLVAENYNICSSYYRRPVRKLLVTHFYSKTEQLIVLQQASETVDWGGRCRVTIVRLSFVYMGLPKGQLVDHACSPLRMGSDTLLPILDGRTVMIRVMNEDVKHPRYTWDYNPHLLLTRHIITTLVLLRRGRLMSRRGCPNRYTTSEYQFRF